MLRELHNTNVRILCRHAHHSHQLSNSYSERYAAFIDTEAGDGYRLWVNWFCDVKEYTFSCFWS